MFPDEAVLHADDSLWQKGGGVVWVWWCAAMAKRWLQPMEVELDYCNRRVTLTGWGGRGEWRARRIANEEHDPLGMSENGDARARRRADVARTMKATVAIHDESALTCKQPLT